MKRRQFEVHFDIQIEFDSGLTKHLTAFSHSEYESRIRPYLKDSRVESIWVSRVERFFHKKFVPVER